jgi:serine protease Do
MLIRETVLSVCVVAGLAAPAGFAQAAQAPQAQAAQPAQPAQPAQTKQETKDAIKQGLKDGVKESIRDDVRESIKAANGQLIAQIKQQTAQLKNQVAQVKQQTQQAAATAVAIARGGSYLGIAIQEIDSDRSKALRLREEAGVEVTRVEKDSPAEKAGVMVGDTVLQYNGQRVEGIEQFSRMVRETPVGRDVKLDLWRNGAAQTVTAKIAARTGGLIGNNFVFNGPDLVLPDIPGTLMTLRTSMLGVEAESLTGQLAQFFGVKEGVLVRSVVANSAAEKGGIKAGDVITSVDNAAVRTPAELTTHIRGARGKTVPVVVMRDHKETTLNVMIADAPGGGGANRVRVRTAGARVIDDGELF